MRRGWLLGFFGGVLLGQDMAGEARVYGLAISFGGRGVGLAWLGACYGCWLAGSCSWCDGVSRLAIYPTSSA